MKTNRFFNIDVARWLNADEYITFDSFVEMCGKGKKTIQYHINNGNIKDCFIKSDVSYINKKEIFNTYLVALEECKEYFGISNKTIEYLVSKGYIKKYKLGDVVAYDACLGGQFAKDYGRYGVKNFKVDTFMTFDKVYRFISDTQGLKVKNEFKKSGDFEIFLVSNRDKFHTCRMPSAVWYVNKCAIYKYFCYTTDEVMEMVGTATDSVLKRMVDDKYLQVIEIHGKKRHQSNYYVNVEGKSIKEYELYKAKIYNNEPNISLDEFDSATEIIDYFLAVIEEDDNLKKTKTLAKNYLYYMAGKYQGGKPKSKIGCNCRCIIRILRTIKRELAQFTDAEIAEFYDNNATGGNHEYIRGFALFVAANSQQCNYSAKSVPVYIQKRHKKTMDDIYSHQIIERYFYCLADINKHFEKAYHNQTYANLWLIAVLHLSLTWRISDILLMPNVDIEAVEINSFEDLLNNGINMADAQVILDQMNDKTYGKVATKNGWQIPFVRDLDLMVQTAAAFILCELHRRKKNDKTLFDKFRKNPPNKRCHWSKFFEDVDLKNFANLKFNSSFMTYLFEYANNKEGLKTLAYTLITRFRGHIVSDSEESNTTKIYLDVITIDGHLDDASMQVQRRGTFGFLWESLLNLAYDTSEASVEDVTRHIENIRCVITAKQIEDISEFLISDEKQKETIEDLLRSPDIVLEKIDEISIRRGQKIANDLGLYIKFSKQEQDEIIQLLKKETKKNLVDKIDKISRGQLPSKIANCQCFKGIKDCQFKTQEDVACTICKYSVPLIFCLMTVKQKIYELIDEIDKLSIDDHFSLMKSKILLIKYMSVISAAKSKFNQYDKELISAFINMDDLKEKVLRVEVDKLIFL